MNMRILNLGFYFTTICYIVFAVSITNAISDFREWINFHEKVYQPGTFDLKHKTWVENHKKIESHNSNVDFSYKLAMNEFGDKDFQEYKLRHGFRLKTKRHHNQLQSSSSWITFSKSLSYKNNNALELNSNGINNNIYQRKYTSIPEAVDWREHGLVSEVKNQGDCGSCFAFSATGSIEGQWRKATGLNVSLSEQQIVDCSKENFGCGGGFMDVVFQYVHKEGGIESESNYPYIAEESGTCTKNKEKFVASVLSFKDIKSGDEDALTEAIATVGPISAAIDADHSDFQFYSEGVYDNPNCSTTEMTHSILIVGYGVENGKKYYLVKNSSGKTWGWDGGYIKMSRGKNNQCGIASYASYPIV